MRCPPPMLVGARVVVRLGRRKDAAAIASYYRVNDLHLSFFETPKPRVFLVERWWKEEITRRQEAFRRGRSCRMFLFDRGAELGEANRVLGAVGLTSIVPGVFHAATMGYSLDERVQGRGLMHEALELVVKYAFEEMKLHRIMANYSPRNLRSARVLRRLGFAVEGYAPDFLFINGVWEDHVLTARVNPDWRPPRGILRREADGRLVEVTPPVKRPSAGRP